MLVYTTVESTEPEVRCHIAGGPDEEDDEDDEEPSAGSPALDSTVEGAKVPDPSFAACSSPTPFVSA